jgi:hypothetical protein
MSGRQFFNIDVSSSLRPSGPTFQEPDVRLRARTGGVFLFFGSPYTLHDLNSVMPSLRDMTSLQLLRLHVDGLERHGSPMTSVPKLPVEWARPARSSADLQVDPKTSSADLATLEDSVRPYPDLGGSTRLGVQDRSLGRGSVPPVSPRVTGYPL